MRAIIHLIYLTLTVGFISGCVHEQKSDNPLQPTNFSDMKDLLLRRTPKLEFFELKGPFKYEINENFAIRLNHKTMINTDLFLATHNEQAPLIIFQHGNRSYKEAHRFQAAHLASWGMHAMVLQLPNENQWIHNGKTLAQFVKLIYRWPALVGNRVDINRIILAGHSFGGSAVSIAASSGAPVNGIILLDPAIFDSTIKNYLRSIHVPVMLLGADKKVFRARKRFQFFKYIPGEFNEISIKDSTHEDAQYPSRFSLEYFGFDPNTSEENQRKFMAAITLSAFSLSATSKFDYAWQTFLNEQKRGDVIHARRK